MLGINNIPPRPASAGPQEKPNDIPEGETPHSVNLYVYEGNVDVCRPGDRVTITGTYRAAVSRGYGEQVEGNVWVVVLRDKMSSAQHMHG